ncbi:MAG TPA: hypothetical protein VIR34_05240, partial [Gemmatimonadaceae bacterium]
HRSADTPILIEIDTHVLLQPADHFMQQVREPRDFTLEMIDSRFERGGTLFGLRDLTLLIQVPE